MTRPKLEIIKIKVANLIDEKVIAKYNSSFVTISRKDLTTDNGFGHYKDQLSKMFNVIRLDGGSFDIAI